MKRLILILTLISSSALGQKIINNVVDNGLTEESDPLSIRLDGTSTPSADIPLGDNKLTGVKTPTDNADAATKAYVDGAVATWAQFAATTNVDMGGANSITNIDYGEYISWGPNGAGFSFLSATQAVSRFWTGSAFSNKYWNMVSD